MQIISSERYSTRSLNIGWATFRQVYIPHVTDDFARNLLKAIGNREQNIDTYAILCSDFRVEVLRDVIQHMPNVATFSTAGNAVLTEQLQRPTVVIAHGSGDDMRKPQCGAVKFVRNPSDDEVLGALVDHVHSDPIENAKQQLQLVPEVLRAGILYYDHQKPAIVDFPEVNRQYKQKAICAAVHRRIKDRLIGMTGGLEIPSYAHQDPASILVTNLHSPPVGFKCFEVDLQENTVHPMTKASIKFAMMQAMTDKKDFQHTHTAIFAFRSFRSTPVGLEEYLREKGTEAEMRSFMERSSAGIKGSIYFVDVGSLVTTYYELVPH